MNIFYIKYVTLKCVPPCDCEAKRTMYAQVSELFERTCENIDIMKNIITGDKLWAYGYDLSETKQQSSMWNTLTSSTLKKAQQVRIKIKETLDFANLIFTNLTFIFNTSILKN